jgi:hypothetical protein
MTITSLSKLCVSVLTLWALNATATPAQHAQQSVQAGGRASGNSVASAGHSLAATGQLVSGVVAVPFLASGTVALGAGSAAVQAGGASMNAASRPAAAPLPLTDETISILPPSSAAQPQPTTPQN